jgi:hypothetical protein
MHELPRSLNNCSLSPALWHPLLAGTATPSLVPLQTCQQMVTFICTLTPLHNVMNLLLTMLCYMLTCPQTGEVRTLDNLTDDFVIFLNPCTGTVPEFSEYFYNTKQDATHSTESFSPRMIWIIWCNTYLSYGTSSQNIMCMGRQLPASSRFARRSTILKAVISLMPLQNCTKNGNNYTTIYTSTQCNPFTDWFQVFWRSLLLVVVLLLLLIFLTLSAVHFVFQIIRFGNGSLVSHI